MFEFFSYSSRDLIDGLKPQANLLRHDYMGTEHLLLSIAKVNQPLAELMGTSYVEVFDSIIQTIGCGQFPNGTVGRRPFTIELKSALADSVDIMRCYRHFPLDPLHILGAMLENDYAPTRVYLGNAGVDADRLLERIDYQLRLLPIWSPFNKPDRNAIRLFQQTYQAAEILQIVR